MFRSFDISASALTMQRLRMDTIAQNVANANTPRYRRRMIVVQEDKNNKPFSAYLDESTKALNGVKVTRIVEDSAPFKLIFDPNHPDADEDGYVRMSNVDILKEMVDMISATRSYEANVTVLNGSKNMAMTALQIGK